jgi:hypothetical protein
LAAVLRASGLEFDVDAFLAGSARHIAKVFHRGEPRLPRTQQDGHKSGESGLNVVVSEAGFHEFAEQITDAIAFLSESAREVRRLVEFPGVTGVVLDFGIACRDVVAKSDQFPAKLVQLAGAFGIALELSHYPVSGADVAAG